MKSHDELPTRFDELLFAKRHKLYGAYELRAAYPATLLKSLGLLIFFAASCCTLAYYLSHRNLSLPIKLPVIDPRQEILKIVEVDLSRKKILPTKPPTDPPSGSPDKKTGSSFLVKDESQKQQDSLVLESQTITKETLITNGNSSITSKGTSGSGSRSDSLTETQPVEIPDEFPEFEGGLKALYAFVSRQIHYPPEALEAMKQGKVSVRFIVDEKGRVILPNALNRPGFGLDREAVRVVGLLPSFKSPARMGGKAVKCYYVLPISFKLH